MRLRLGRKASLFCNAKRIWRACLFVTLGMCCLSFDATYVRKTSTFLKCSLPGHFSVRTWEFRLEPSRAKVCAVSVLFALTALAAMASAPAEKKKKKKGNLPWALRGHGHKNRPINYILADAKSVKDLARL